MHELFFDEPIVVEGIAVGGKALVTLLDGQLDEAGDVDVDEDVDALLGVEFNGEVVVEGEVDDLLMIDPH